MKLQSAAWILGYLEARLEWYKRNYPEEVLVIKELSEVITKTQA